MPDWSYHPLLRHLPPRLLIRGADALAHAPGGGRLIEAVGDAKPPAGVTVAGVDPHHAAAQSARAPRRRRRARRAGRSRPGRQQPRAGAGAARRRRGARVRRRRGAAGGRPRPRCAASTPRSAVRRPRASGGAAQALGFSMMLAGVIVWLVARGPVLLGYDEAFVGLTKAELTAANDRLLPFMEHDRATLAGVMIALGALYAGLAHGRAHALGVGRRGRVSRAGLRVVPAVRRLRLLRPAALRADRRACCRRSS